MNLRFTSNKNQNRGEINRKLQQLKKLIEQNEDKEIKKLIQEQAKNPTPEEIGREIIVVGAEDEQEVENWKNIDRKKRFEELI